MSRARERRGGILPDAAAELVALRRDHFSAPNVSCDLCATQEIFSEQQLDPKLARSVKLDLIAPSKTRMPANPRPCRRRTHRLLHHARRRGIAAVQ